MERPNSAKSVEPEGTAFTAPADRTPARKRSHSSKLTEWQRFFLSRLDHLLDVQREKRADDEASSTLMSKALYSTYLDCQTQGVGEEALQRIGANGTSGEPSAN
jgi:hypothetical protein